MYSKVLSTILGTGFVLYGVFCFVQPDAILNFIGYAATTDDASTEFLAMYGGVQTAIGLFGLYAVMNPSNLRANMFLLSIVFAFLAASRAYGYLAFENLGGYTLIAIVFETVSLILCLVGFRREKRLTSVKPCIGKALSSQSLLSIKPGVDINSSLENKL